MANFQFLQSEFKPLYEPAKGAEQLVHSDPRACCARTRHALEQAVHWLYESDRDLRMPYDNSLGVLLTQPAFEKLLPPHIHQKARLIQKLGNQAVHGNQRIGSGDALRLVRELFHVLFWLARTYTRASDPKSIVAEWDDKRVPQLVRADEAVAFTRDELKKQETKFPPGDRGTARADRGARGQHRRGRRHLGRARGRAGSGQCRAGRAARRVGAGQGRQHRGAGHS